MPSESGVQSVVRPIVKVDGVYLTTGIIQQLVELTVDTSFDVPDMFVMRFQDEEFELIDGTNFDLGKKVEVGFVDNLDQEVIIMEGEITGLEPQYDEDLTYLTVRGYDKRHRLTLGTKIRVFLKQTDSDMVRKIAGEAGIPVDIEATSDRHDYVCQHDQTDYEFIQERARLNGYEVGFKGDKLTFKKPVTNQSSITLKRGNELRTFTPRLSAANQVQSVVVKGWDPVTKKEVVGEASSSASNPTIGFGKNGGQAARTAFGVSGAKYIEVRYNVNQAQAQALAKSLLNDINAGFVEAEGMAFGDPSLKAGSKVKLEKLGARFSGTYVVTSATHTFTKDGYDTWFRIEGSQPKLMADIVQGQPDNRVFSQWQGVVPAVVTNIYDQQNTTPSGRVKVKFPWLDDSLESNWARVAGPGAGAKRGIWWMPEVNDEVLVAFEQGDFNRPVIVGGLWNGKDETPDTWTNAVKNGKVVRRIFKSRLGHTIQFVDDSGDEYIEIVDSKQGTTIKLDAQKKELTVTCEGNITIKAKGNTKVETTGNTEVKSTGNLTMSSDANVSIKGGANVNVEATAQLVLKGAIVNIN